MAISIVSVLKSHGFLIKMPLGEKVRKPRSNAILDRGYGEA